MAGGTRYTRVWNLDTRIWKVSITHQPLMKAKAKLVLVEHGEIIFRQPVSGIGGCAIITADVDVH